MSVDRESLFVTDGLHLVPGSDPGACPDCGGWIRAGIAHDCEDHREQMAKDAAELVELIEANHG